MRAEFFVPDDLWPVEADEGQISQVVGNLTINADQAMAEGGVFRVRCANRVVREEDGLPLLPGRYIHVAFSDTGVGIPKENLAKIFDPYFTDKAHGNGLGLATTYSVILKHEGYITVESEVGQGTTFHIYLPASDKVIEEAAAEGGMDFSGQGKVLLMDDEEMIRKVGARMLQRLGYEVETARDGGEAIERYREARRTEAPFDSGDVPVSVRDERLHNIIARASGNPIAVILLNAFTRSLADYAFLYFESGENRLRSETFHREIFRDIRKKEPEKARKTMLDVMRFAEEATARAYAAQRPTR